MILSAKDQQAIIGRIEQVIEHARRDSSDRASVTLVIPGSRPASWNTYFAGVHWTKRRERETNAVLEVRAAIDPNTAVLFSQRVDIDIVAYFKGTPQDADNICTKPYIDGLIGFYIQDDSPKFVRRVSTESRQGKPARVEIRISEAV